MAKDIFVTEEAEQASQNEPSPWTKFLWWLSAVDADVMKECGTDRFRYTIIGYTVLATWIFATLSWGYFFSTLFEDAAIVVPAALFFGFVILSIDRGLIAGLNNGGRNKWLFVVLRLSLAMTIGFFLSQPIVLMLFQKDVDSHLPVIKEKKIQAYTNQVRAENAISIEQAKTEVDRLRNLQTSKEQHVLDLKNDYIKETDGTGGSGKVGEYTVAKVKKSAYLQAQDELTTWKRETQSQLDSALAKQKKVDQSIQDQIDTFSKGLNDGFLTRVETLDDLMVVHPPVKYRYRLVIMLIMLIELMPLLTKLMMASGLYEERMQLESERKKLGWQNERAGMKELEKEFYRQTYEADRRLQERIGREMEAYNNRKADELFHEYERNPDNVRNFWDRLKTQLFFFRR
ncbi:MAG: hypothetical protein DI598_03230 [Pseudopedobacter saltans]|uniref:DUF4407 domain-containing protein n=1 Tax=Pseudopedobacter saltans TaxID=151895 RepID=A0A2W5FAX5_9SPHI|nr:MAG: hypothetical protein DI598_03230 [Pseudopedobacter saltans]